MKKNQKNATGDSNSDSPVNPVVSPPTSDEVQRVEAEPMSGGGKGTAGSGSFRQARTGYRFGQVDGAGGGVYYHYSAGEHGPMARPPILATWVCLLMAWIFLGSRIPFTVLLGLPLNFLALLLAGVSFSRGGLVTGILVFLLGTAGSFLVYLVGLFRLLAH